MHTGRELGCPEADPRARSGRRLDDQPVPIAVHLAQPGAHMAYSERIRAGVVYQHGADDLGIRPRAVVLDADQRVAAVVDCVDGDCDDSVVTLHTVAYGVLDQRLHDEEGTAMGSTSGATWTT